nr:hypothetical protein [Tanacetum cinerariifolium]
MERQLEKRVLGLCVDTIGLFLLDRRNLRRTMNASECVSKVCALECNFLSPTLKMEAKRTPLVDYIEKPKKDVTVSMIGVKFPQNTSLFRSLCISPLHITLIASCLTDDTNKLALHNKGHIVAYTIANVKAF